LPGLFSGLLFCPGASEENKRWPWENFARVARQLQERSGMAVQFVGGPSEAGWLKTKVALLGGSYASAVRILQDTDELFDLIQQAMLVVSNDAGPAHLSAALNIPSLTIFGAQDPRVWHPYDPARHPVALAEVPCRPCGLRICPLENEKYIQCLTKISVEEVLQKVNDLLVSEKMKVES
jgi:heptosyltransferase-2